MPPGIYTTVRDKRNAIFAEKFDKDGEQDYLAQIFAIFSQLKIFLTHFADRFPDLADRPGFRSFNKIHELVDETLRTRTVQQPFKKQYELIYMLEQLDTLKASIIKDLDPIVDIDSRQDREHLDKLLCLYNLHQPYSTFPFVKPNAYVDGVQQQLEYRRKHAENLQQFSDFFENASSELLDDITARMKSLHGRFLLQMAAECDSRSYHDWPHAVEMATDPGKMVTQVLTERNLLEKEKAKAEGRDPRGLRSNEQIQFLATLANWMGAAHDIIQGIRTPSMNERKSADIFIKIMQEMIDNAIEQGDYLPLSPEGILLQKLRESIPTIAEEGIVNGTWLGFTTGKRTICEMVNQIEASVFGECSLPDDLEVLQTAIAHSDTRRSEQTQAIEDIAILKSIPEPLVDVLLTLCQKAGIGLSPGLDAETLSDILKIYRNESPTSDIVLEDWYDDLKKIESFLLRFAQNVRMVTELGAHPFGGAPEAEKTRRADMLRGARGVSLDKYPTKEQENLFECFVTPVQQAIQGMFGEISFAKGLGGSADEVSQAIHDQISMQGWESHADHLQNIHQFLSEGVVAGAQQAMGQLFCWVAANQPGAVPNQDLYLSMLENYPSLVSEYAEAEKWDEIARMNNAIRQIAQASGPLAYRVAEEFFERHLFEPAVLHLITVDEPIGPFHDLPPKVLCDSIEACFQRSTPNEASFINQLVLTIQNIDSANPELIGRLSDYTKVSAPDWLEYLFEAVQEERDMVIESSETSMTQTMNVSSIAEKLCGQNGSLHGAYEEWQQAQAAAQHHQGAGFE